MKDKPKPVCELVVNLRKSATNFKDLIEIESLVSILLKKVEILFFLGKIQILALCPYFNFLQKTQKLAIRMLKVPIKNQTMIVFL
jgi:hypothetical protein